MQYFQAIEDPRVDRTKRHNLIAMITIAIFAVLAGAEGFVAIETYGKAKQGWLEKFLDLPYGIPSHDTFARVLGMLEPSQLQSSFLSWVSSISEKLDIELIHIDGKTAKGSYDREGQLKALHSVSAWSSEYGLVLGQQKVSGRSNEITAVPLLLQLLCHVWDRLSVINICRSQLKCKQLSTIVNNQMEFTSIVPPYRIFPPFY
jgi:hypothetical protein